MLRNFCLQSFNSSGFPLWPQIIFFFTVLTASWIHVWWWDPSFFSYSPCSHQIKAVKSGCSTTLQVVLCVFAPAELPMAALRQDDQRRSFIHQCLQLQQGLLRQVQYTHHLSQRDSHTHTHISCQHQVEACACVCLQTAWKTGCESPACCYCGEDAPEGTNHWR